MRALRLILRLTFAALIVGGGLLLLGFLSFKFVLQPQVTIMAPAGSTVRLLDTRSGATTGKTTVSGTSATLSMDIGDYQVIVNNNGGSQVFYVQTAWLKRISLRFAPPAQLTSTQLEQQVAYDAVGDADHLTYLNTSTQTIGQLNRGVGISVISTGSVGAQAIKVISNNRAIVLAGGKLHVIEDGRMDPLRTDGFPDTVSSLVVGTNPGQESFAVLANNELYWYQSPSAQPQHIAKLGKQADQLAVGGDQVIAYSTRMPDAKQDIRYAYAPTYAVDPIVVSVTSGNQHTVGRGPIVDASISPDGQYATVEQRDTTHTDIVRLSDSVIIQSVENADTLTPVWISNSRYVYGKGSSVLMFDVATQIAATIATLPGNQPITSITYNATLHQYFVTTYPSEQEAAIYQLQ